MQTNNVLCVSMKRNLKTRYLRRSAQVESESESDDSSSSGASSASSETLYTESYSSETSTADSDDNDFIDDSSVVDASRNTSKWNTLTRPQKFAY